LYLDCGTLRVVLTLENPDVSQHKGRVDGPRPEGLAVFQGASECKGVEDENDDEDGNDRGRKEASRKSHTRVVAMLTRLIDRFDTDDTRNRES
jgi:hypothetical protein